MRIVTVAALLWAVLVLAGAGPVVTSVGLASIVVGTLAAALREAGRA